MNRSRRIKQCQSKVSQWIAKIALKLVENYLPALIVSILASLTSGIIAGDAKCFLYGLALILFIVITCLWFQFKKNWISFFYIFPLLLVAAIYFNQDWIDDLQYRFKKSEEVQVIGIIIPDFKSPIPKDGAIFAESLYTQLNNKIISPLKIELIDTSLSLEIKVQKLDVALDATEIRIRGKRRNADLGIIGNYRCYIEKGQHKEEITDFKVVILDTLIANIFKEEKPFGDIHEFIINIDDISVTQRESLRVEEKAVLPIEYILNTAANTKLLKRAINVNKLLKNQTLRTINQRFSDLGKRIKNPSMACFHHGNSLVRAAMSQKLPLDKQRECFKEATNAYKKSIDSLSSVQQETPLKLRYPERIFLNLAWTYMQLDTLTGESAYKDSAEAVYDSVIARYYNSETLEEQHNFLDHRCVEEFVAQKNPSRFKHAERLYNKYQECADKLETEIRTKSRQPSKEDQKILNKIKENKEFFEAHLNKLRQIRQDV